MLPRPVSSQNRGSRRRRTATGSSSSWSRGCISSLWCYRLGSLFPRTRRSRLIFLSLAGLAYLIYQAILLNIEDTSQIKPLVHPRFLQNLTPAVDWDYPAESRYFPISAQEVWLREKSPRDYVKEAIKTIPILGECSAHMTGEILSLDSGTVPLCGSEFPMESTQNWRARMVDYWKQVDYQRMVEQKRQEARKRQLREDFRRRYRHRRDSGDSSYQQITLTPSDALDEAVSSIHFIFPSKFSASFPVTITPGSTTINCKQLDKKLPETFCESRNITIRMRAIPDQPSPNTNLVLDLMPQRDSGAIQASCGINNTWWMDTKVLGEGAARWLHHGLEVVSDSDEIKCDAWIDTPLFMVSRWDTTNPYQAHQDFINTFQVYASLGLSPADMQVVLLDSRVSDGPYTFLWSHAFSFSGQLPDIRDIRNYFFKQYEDTASSPSSSSKQNANICFKRIVWGIHGGISPLHRDTVKRTQCHNSRLLLSFRAFMLDKIRSSVLQKQQQQTTTTGNTPKLPAGSVHLQQSGPYKGLSNGLPRLAVPPTVKFLNTTPPTNMTIKEITYGIRKSWWTRRFGEWTDHVRLIPDDNDDARGGVGGELRQRVQVPPVVITFAKRGAPTRTRTHLDEVMQQLEVRSDRGPAEEETTKKKSPLTRVISNEDEVIESMRQEIMLWNLESRIWDAKLDKNKKGKMRTLVKEAVEDAAVRILFRAVDFAGLPFPEQVAVAQDTDILIGPHGAVFAHLLYLRSAPVAGVVEMKPPERSGANYQFYNLAHQLGHRYASAEIASGKVFNIPSVLYVLKVVTRDVYRSRQKQIAFTQQGRGSEFESPATNVSVI